MKLNKPNQELFIELKAAASALDDAAHELFQVAKQGGEAEFLVMMDKILKLHERADKLEWHAEEVKAGKIVRANSQ